MAIPRTRSIGYKSKKTVNPQPMISRRTLNIPANVFAGMDQRVSQAVSQGIDVIDLSKANPDLRTPQFIVEAGQKALNDLSNHRYSQFDGKPGFLRAAQEWYARTQRVRLDWHTQLLATCGSIVALTALTQATLEPGDVMAVTDPHYPPYDALAQACGAELVPIPCSWRTGFLPDFTAVKNSTWSRTKLLLLNYPNNPTGAIASPDLYDEAIALAHRYGFLVANDFAYAGLETSGTHPTGLLATVGSDNLAVEIVGLSKMYGMAGWRIGFAAGPAWLMTHIREYHHQLCSSPTGAVQDAGAAALNSDQTSVHELSARYAKRRIILTLGLTNAGFDVFPSQGALFVWAKVPKGYSSEEYANTLLDHAQVAVMPGSCFGASGEGYIRLSLLDNERRLEEAVKRITALTH